MANYKQKNYKAERKSRAVKVFAALALSAVMLAGGCAVGFGVGTNWTYKRGNIQAEQPSVPDGGNNGDNGDNQGSEFTDGDLIHATETNGIKLMSARIAPEDYEQYGIDAQAETAYRITATVNEDAADKSVIGGLSWKNASSSWASGKHASDYITLNQITEYGLEFTLSVKQAFGEPIIFKVASCIDSNVNATVQIDYLKKLKRFTAVTNPSLSKTAAGRYYVGDTVNTIEVTPTYDVGTVTGTISGYRAELMTNSFLQSNLKSALNAGNGTSSYGVATCITVSGKDFKIPFTYVGSNWGNGLVFGSGNDNAATIIANNFIKQRGCTDATGSAASTAGVSSTKYYITYSYGNSYRVELSYTDDKGYGFRNDNLSSIATITNINTDKSNIVVIPN